MRLPALLLAACALSAAAQTTDTERRAAKPVLDAIDKLQTQLNPTVRGNAMPAKADADRDKILARAEYHWKNGMEALSDWIGHNPEVGFKEFKAVDTLVKVLKSAGFKVETPVAGLATAFVATWDSPAGTNGPVIG